MEHIEHINRIELQGRVGTVRTNEHNGSKVVNFSVMTELFYKSREGIPMDDSIWHNVVAWSGKDIDIQVLDRIEKGVPVNVIGRLRQSRYTSSDGTEKLFYEVLASRVTVLKDIR